jgi:hypothetical protein
LNRGRPSKLQRLQGRNKGSSRGGKQRGQQVVRLWKYPAKTYLLSHLTSSLFQQVALGGGGTSSEDPFVRRNMLMNIILRPGGGEKAKALPRPKVEVSSEGSNVILVRLTFPENENIQGLRAFTPTDPR